MELVDYIMALRNLVRDAKDIPDSFKRRLNYHLDDLYAALSLGKPYEPNYPQDNPNAQAEPPAQFTDLIFQPPFDLKHIDPLTGRLLPHRPFPGGPLDPNKC